MRCSPTRASRDLLLTTALVLAIPLAALHLGWSRRWVTEDAFIDFRVVQNLLSGHGPVFNIGERVEAYTSPLWVALLALVSAPLWPFLHEGTPIEWISVALGLGFTVLGFACATLGALRLARALGRSGRAWPAGALAVLAVPVGWDFMTSGLETGLITGWLGVSFWALTRSPRRGRAWLPIFIGLGPLVRPDLALYSVGFLGLLVAGVTRRGRSIGGGRLRGLPLLGVVAGAAAIPSAYQLFRMGYFAALVPNTAIAKEAGLARWDQGRVYFLDFAGTYWLGLPFAALLVAGLYGFASSPVTHRARRLRSAAIAGVPVLCAAAHALYVTRIGGDFMHGRFLLPDFFAALMPVSIVVARRRDLRRPGRARIAGHLVAGGLALTLVPWALVCASSLGREFPEIAAASEDGIADERAYFAHVTGRAHPVVLADYADREWFRWGRAARAIAEQRRALLPWREHVGRPQEMELAPEVIASVVAARFNVGVYGYAAGPRVHVVDRLGLSDPIAARVTLLRRGRPGHEKDLPDEWEVARFGQIARDPGTVGLDPNIAAAAAALRCGDLAELVRAVGDPLTPSRFLSNVALAWRLTRLRFPADPVQAEGALCVRIAR